MSLFWQFPQPQKSTNKVVLVHIYTPLKQVLLCELLRHEMRRVISFTPSPPFPCEKPHILIQYRFMAITGGLKKEAHNLCSSLKLDHYSPIVQLTSEYQTSNILCFHSYNTLTSWELCSVQSALSEYFKLQENSVQSVLSEYFHFTRSLFCSELVEYFGSCKICPCF